MIQLDVDLLYLAKNFEVGTKRISRYGDKSIEDIMKSEAAGGNAKAAKFDLTVLRDPKELVKVFRLFSPRNRYKIIKNMNNSDLHYLLRFLEPKDLVVGLNFFTKEKLVKLMYNLPKEKIAKILFNKFSLEKFLKLVPEKEMNLFFESEKLDKRLVQKSLENLPPEALEGLMENITGSPVKRGIDKKLVIKTMENLPPKKFKKALQSLNKDYKARVIKNIVQKDPKMMLEFSKDALMFPIKQLEKPEMIKNMAVLKPEDMINMLGELPKDLLAVIVTQIDPEVFADVLCNRFQDVLASIAVS